LGERSLAPPLLGLASFLGSIVSHFRSYQIQTCSHYREKISPESHLNLSILLLSNVYSRPNIYLRPSLSSSMHRRLPGQILIHRRRRKQITRKTSLTEMVYLLVVLFLFSYVVLFISRCKRTFFILEGHPRS
jgi:hypothetical protein